jgi:tetratricopeptide (TPR) repeat protein
MTKRALAAGKIVAICAALIALTWIVFGQTLGHQFVNFDDGSYVYRNSIVARGLSVDGIKWAFTHSVAANWHPVTVLSHMVDCQFYGLAPGGHHFTNVALHSIAVVLLFVLLWNMTGFLWRSAFVAAVFAIHPLHVESVAWIAERKDVLSAVFFMLTLNAYVWYARQPSRLRYFIVLACFVFGLMSKPMLVTVPFLLLLLDYWPLGRFHRGSSPRKKKSNVRSLVLEKVPMLVLAAATGVVALLTQHQSINLVATTSLWARVANAFAAILVYIGQTVWPVRLAVFYPHPEGNISFTKVLFAVAAIIVLTTAAYLSRKRAPYFFVGWFWFLGMLLPVLGIVQVGIQAHADRYTYLPQVGLCLGGAWMAADVSSKWRYRQIILALAALAVLVPLTRAARLQASYWYGGRSLWQHALAVTPDNEPARVHLSDAFLQSGQIADALEQARLAAATNPESAESHGVLGAALARSNNLDEAIKELQRAAQLDANLPRVYYNLGNVLAQRGAVEDAISAYEKDLRIENLPEAHNNLALLLLRNRQLTLALEHLKTALELKPDYSEARNNFAIALSQAGQMREAIAQWERTLELEPDNLQAQCNLAWVYSTSPEDSIRKGAKAVQLAERAVQLSGRKNPRVWRLAAAAYAEAGRYSEAIKAAEAAVEYAQSAQDFALVRTLEGNLKLFQANSPLRDVRAVPPLESR